MNPTFEEGDIVRVKCEDKRFNGRIGIVDFVYNRKLHGRTHTTVHVKLGSKYLGFATGELELVEGE